MGRAWWLEFVELEIENIITGPTWRGLESSLAVCLFATYLHYYYPFAIFQALRFAISRNKGGI